MTNQEITRRVKEVLNNYVGESATSGIRQLVSNSVDCENTGLTFDVVVHCGTISVKFDNGLVVTQDQLVVR